MGQEIQFTDTRIEYLSVTDARRAKGLRLVLGAYAVPGPWREACKGLFDVKGIPYASVANSNSGASDIDLGVGGTQSELIAWTGQSSSPVAIWKDEHPRSTWPEQLNLAERLNPEPRLIPADIDLRMQMFGLINEIAGENGFGWCRRLQLIQDGFEQTKPDEDGYEFWKTLAGKYVYTAEAAAAASKRCVEVIGRVGAILEAQKSTGSRYLIGDALSAADIYMATFYALIEPLPEAQCPMATSYRPAYINKDPAVAAAVTPGLTEHRDFIYAEHLVLPIVF